jgi:hypothetical protein
LSPAEGTSGGSAGTTARPRPGRQWEALLHGLRADALDCLQTSIALAADHAYGRDSHLALGSVLRWDFTTARGIACIRRSLDDRLHDAEAVLGVRVRHRRSAAGGAAVRRLLADLGRLYVVADAFDLPWVPYAGHRHLTHSFLLEPGAVGYRVVDGYHNDTEWGAARPGTWVLSAEEVDAALARGVVALVLEAAAAPPAIDEESVVAENAARAAAAAADVETYLGALRSQAHDPAALEQLVLDVWLLARERRLHAAWLAGSRGYRALAPDAAAVADAWSTLAARSYLAMRRSRRGLSAVDYGSVVDDLANRFRADTELAAARLDRSGSRAHATMQT